MLLAKTMGNIAMPTSREIPVSNTATAITERPTGRRRGA